MFVRTPTLCVEGSAAHIIRYRNNDYVAIFPIDANACCMCISTTKSFQGSALQALYLQYGILVALGRSWSPS